jgi:RNA polymerase primary sigma factor
LIQTVQKVLKHLSNFENEFPNKDKIVLDDAISYIKNILKTDVKPELIIQYLKQKGYQQIIEKSTKNDEENNNLDDWDDDDFDINEFLISKPEQDMAEPIRKFKSTGRYEENIDLIRDFHQKRDVQTFSEIINKNIRLVQKVASKYQNYMNHKLDYEDLVSEGILGLMKAVVRFDPNAGTQFSTYAIWWIRQAIIRAIIDKGSTIRLPVHLAEQIRNLIRAENESYLQFQKIDVKWVCKSLNITEEKYKELKLIDSRFSQMRSIHTIVSEEDDDTELIDLISNESNLAYELDIKELKDPFELTYEREVREKIMNTLNQLSDREKEIIIERFGLRDGDPKTLEVIGQKMGLSRERIRQIESKAMKRLRRRIRRKEWGFTN